MIIGYLDLNPKNMALEEQKASLYRYADENGLKIDILCDKNNIAEMADIIQAPSSTLLVANVVSFGESLETIASNIALFNRKNVTLISVSEQQIFAPSAESEIMMKGLRLACDLHHSLASVLTKNILRAKRAEGQKFGRPFGHFRTKTVQNGQFVLDSYKKGVSKAEIARQLGVAWTTIHNFIRKSQAVEKGGVQ